MERSREKSGNMAKISEREQRQSPGQISKRHGIPERKVMRDTTTQANIQCRAAGGEKQSDKRWGIYHLLEESWPTGK